MKTLPRNFTGVDNSQPLNVGLHLPPSIAFTSVVQIMPEV